MATSDPTVDNDGDALVAGALYFNSTDGEMKVYNGTSWVDAYADGASLVAKSGDTMTGALIINADLTVDTDTLHVDSANNRVGIGTTSPSTDLHIEKSKASANVDFLIKNSGTTSSSNTRILSYVSGASGGDPSIGVGITGVQDYFWRIDNDDSDKLKLDSNGTTRMTIDSSGNVGIGTNSPATALDVNGTINVRTSGYQFGRITTNNVDTNNGGLTFQTISGGSFSERMRIDSSGNVGIGNTAPSEILDIKSTSSAPTIRIHADTTSSPAPAIELQRGTNDTWGADNYTDFRIENSEGHLKFFGGDSGTTSEYMRLENDKDLHVDGNVVAYSTTISDIRLKKDIAPIEDAVTKVQQLNGCTFTYLKDDRKSAGLIAQDVEKVLPSAVIEDEAVFHGEEGETYKTVQYDQLIGLLVEAVKELKAEIEELKDASSK